MTDDQQQEYALLKLANDHGVFAIELVATLGIEQQRALERLLRRRWLTLIDVAQIKTAPGLFRLFLASPEALTWYRASG